MSIAFPGFVSDVHSADALDPAWGNAIRDRALQVFDTATNRDAAITVPKVGQVGVLTTLATAGLYAYAGATDGWRAPWNLPWGYVNSAASTSFSQAVVSTTGIDLSGLSVTFTALANRFYKASLFGLIGTQSGSAATSKCFIVDGSNNLLSVCMDELLTSSSSGSRAHVGGIYVMGGASAGSVTVKARALTSAGTCTFACDSSTQAVLVVEDIGPNGAPS